MEEERKETANIESEQKTDGAEGDDKGFMFTLASIIVNKRKAFLVFFAIAIAFSLAMINAVQVDDDLTDEQRSEYFGKAAQYAQKVIDSNQYALEENFYDNWNNRCVQYLKRKSNSIKFYYRDYLMCHYDYRYDDITYSSNEI